MRIAEPGSALRAVAASYVGIAGCASAPAPLYWDLGCAGNRRFAGPARVRTKAAARRGGRASVTANWGRFEHPKSHHLGTDFAGPHRGLGDHAGRDARRFRAVSR